MNRIIGALTATALLASSTAALATRPASSLPTHMVSASSAGVTAGLRAGPTLRGESDLVLKDMSPAAIAIFLGISIGLAVVLYHLIHDDNDFGVTP